MVCLQFKQYQALLSKQNKDTATREPLNQPVYKLTWLFLVDKSINHLLVSQMASYHAHLGGNNGLLGKINQWVELVVAFIVKINVSSEPQKGRQIILTKF